MKWEKIKVDRQQTTTPLLICVTPKEKEYDNAFNDMVRKHFMPQREAINVVQMTQVSSIC